MESLDLTKTEVNSLRKAETNVLKRLLGLTVQCKTTELIRGLRIEPTHIFEKDEAEFPSSTLKQSFNQ